MTTLIPSQRAAATAAASLGACLAFVACPSGALANALAKNGFESQSLNLSSSPSSSHASSGGASLVRTIVGLAIVIAVIWGLSWILRQVKTGKDPHVPSAGLESVAALALSSGRSVHLVKAGSEYHLLASAEHGLVPIHRYTEEEARDAGLLAAVEAPPPRKRYQALLKAPPDRPGERHDPMRMPSPGPGTTVLERLRELTVRR